MAANARLTISSVPLAIPEIVRRARVILNAGQAGTAAMSMLAGIPMLALPQHNEHGANARGAAATGAHRVLYRDERSKAAVLGTLIEMWEDSALWDRAQTLALRLRAETPKGALTVTREALVRF